MSNKLIWINLDIHSYFVDTNIFGHSFVSKFSQMSHSDSKLEEYTYRRNVSLHYNRQCPAQCWWMLVSWSYSNLSLVYESSSSLHHLQAHRNQFWGHQQRHPHTLEGRRMFHLEKGFHSILTQKASNSLASGNIDNFSDKYKDI